MRLPHSFFGQHYVYQAQKTEDIMDYSHKGSAPVNNIVVILFTKSM
ncbi:hypothetical protein V3470_05775 [Flavobacterium oreochromis]|uniref:Uncharacterized protein n=1 Tax=Flavobacterium oreochromis TaxID=2906078 RepID=A0ABW8P4P1_9FLAO